MIRTIGIGSALRKQDKGTILVDNFAEFPLTALARRQTCKITVTF